MIQTTAMQSRTSALPSSIKTHFRMDERSGLFVSNSVNRSQYNPSSIGTDGSLAFSQSNAVTITNNSDSLSVPCDFDISIDLSKTVILAACIKMSGVSGTRVAIGTAAETNVMTNSTLGGLHGGLLKADTTEGAYLNTLAGFEFLDNTNAYIHYVLWNGVDTITLKVINLSGAVYNNGTNDLLRTGTTATFGAFTTETFSLGNVARWTGGHYYGISCWELDYLPNKLDLKLANWGNLLVNGYKGAIELT